MSNDPGIRLKSSGHTTGPTLIYLPGLHGDPTLLGTFPDHLPHLHLVRITYPLNPNLSLQDLAEAVIREIEREKIERGWLLGESFGSLLAWEVIRTGKFQVEGLILSGGFVTYPFRPAVKAARFLHQRIPQPIMLAALRFYCWYAILRQRKAPNVRADIQLFLQGRAKPGDRECILARYNMILENDFRDVATSFSAPVFLLAGWIDPVVPFFVVRQWLQRHCPGYRASVLMWGDHNVLGTASARAASQIVSWIFSEPTTQPTWREAPLR